MKITQSGDSKISGGIAAISTPGNVEVHVSDNSAWNAALDAAAKMCMEYVPGEEPGENTLSPLAEAILAMKKA